MAMCSVCTIYISYPAFLFYINKLCKQNECSGGVYEWFKMLLKIKSQKLWSKTEQQALSAGRWADLPTCSARCSTCWSVEVCVCHSRCVGKTDKKAPCWCVWVSVVRLFVCSLSWLGAGSYPTCRASFLHVSLSVSDGHLRHVLLRQRMTWTDMIVTGPYCAKLEELREKQRWDRY